MNSLVSLAAALLLTPAGQPPLPDAPVESKLLRTIRQARDHGDTLRGSSARKHYRGVIVEMLALARCPALIDVLESAIADSEQTNDDATAADALRAGIAEAERMLNLRLPRQARSW